MREDSREKEDERERLQPLEHAHDQTLQRGVSQEEERIRKSRVERILKEKSGFLTVKCFVCLFKQELMHKVRVNETRRKDSCVL